MNKTTVATITLVLGSLLAGHAFAADASTETKATETQPAAKALADSKAKSAADAYAELDKIKKW